MVDNNKNTNDNSSRGGLLGNWYDTSSRDKARERRQQRRERRRKLFKKIKWAVIGCCCFFSTAFLMTNFDRILGRDPTIVIDRGRGDNGGYFIYVTTRDERVWLPHVDWDSVNIGDEIVLIETRQGTRIDTSPLGIFRNIMPIIDGQ